ncbi:MAG: DUF3048 domain-containing protein [Burkholderiaceae bacterium]|nr:DUF3048 domain-containing protein [Microbacteriaceae bacterium]
MSLRRAPLPSIGASVALAALVAITTGCTTQAPPVTPSPSVTYESTYVAPPVTDTAPLRGTSVEVGSLAHASIAAKIDNHPDARPQLGLEQTDIVFEELVEGGLTRYVAVWQSTIPELLGPVRSIRPMDPDIISPFGGIVAYSGGQERFVNLMRQTPVYNAIHGQPDTASTFYRLDTKSAPHNVVVKAREVLAAHTDLAAPAQQFAFAPDVASSTAAKDGTPTAAINYRFSTQVSGSWGWNADTATFLRFQGQGADVDSSGTQLGATNVVVMRVPVSINRDIPETEIVGTGEAWISTGGATVHATWSKESPTSAVHLADDNGVAVRLAAGNTWIELVPLAGSVTFAAPAA